MESNGILIPSHGLIQFHGSCMFLISWLHTYLPLRFRPSGPGPMLPQTLLTSGGVSFDVRHRWCAQVPRTVVSKSTPGSTVEAWVGGSIALEPVVWWAHWGGGTTSD